MMSGILSKVQITRLRNTTHPESISKLLFSFTSCRLTAPAVIKQYHDLLLFYCAFPADKKIYELAKMELHHIAMTLKKTTQTNSIKSFARTASGIAHTELFCCYSNAIAQWLINRFPSAVEFDCSEASMDTVRNTLQLLLPGVEFEKTTQGEYGLGKRIQLLSAKKNKAALLEWILQAFNESKLPLAVKEELYRQLKIFIRWRLTNEHFSRTFLRLPVEKIFYHKDFIKNPDSATIIKQAITKPMKLSKAAKNVLADTMKASLSFQYRETDPISFADTNELELFEMGRGLQIALVGMVKEKRLSLESYIGFMAFKNGVPVSYGGGWLWGHRCKIGINIFAPFRRGESAWLFYQVLRVYYQHFGARYFVVNPYQFGKGNPDGLKSGAFWFYYKAGFRPEESAIRKAADAEWKKIKQNKNYRTPVDVLRQFTFCYAVWDTDKTIPATKSANQISAAISTWISRHHEGSRKKALEIANKQFQQKYPADVLKSIVTFQQEVVNNWSLIKQIIKNSNYWSNQNKKGLVQLIRLQQQGEERDYILRLQKHKKLWKSLHDVDQKAGSR